MLVSLRQNSCYYHDNLYKQCLKLVINVCIIRSAPINPCMTPIDRGRHNKITHRCILSLCTVHKNIEIFNLLVLISLTSIGTVYLFVIINQLLNLPISGYFWLIFGFNILKNIKNHVFIGPPLKTEVFNTIFCLDLVLKMSTKSCARILKNTCFSSTGQPQKTALKNAFLTVSLQNFLPTSSQNPYIF